MNRRPLSDFEEPARALAEERGRDPLEPTFYGDKNGAKRPLWVNYAENLRSHWEKNQALKEFV